MKKVFPEFNKYSESEFKEIFNKCTFVLDANVLLNLYRYSNETKNELLEILGKIKERLWMPYQVGLEYNFNRLPVIIEQEKLYQKMITDIEGAAKKFKNDIGSKYNKKHPSIKWDEIKKRMDSCINELVTDLKKKEDNHPNWFTNDDVQEKLNELFEGKVGEKYLQDELEKVYKEGETRYAKKFPPGYEDLKDKEGKTKEYEGVIYKDEYGDLVMWKQIIDYAIKSKKPIIFITDDTKEDWWKEIKGKKIGPRIELLNEMKMKANVPFYMYRTDSFMKQIKMNLNQNINDAAIQEVKELRENYLSEKTKYYILDEDEKEREGLDLEKFNEYKKKVEDTTKQYYKLISNINEKSDSYYIPERVHLSNRKSKRGKSYFIDTEFEIKSLIREIEDLATEATEDYARDKIQLILDSEKEDDDRIIRLRRLRNNLHFLETYADDVE
ncbi:PIN-like domain-containing protein [Bacillus wiedmannii]|uniref:PIN-like domain-containing protein n=1 Tax=Bacillus wiedmannii TaxID=1890302 RepID=UPI000B44F740|nr:PIN-like domain-containing protein [Bacillus wiedmannii]OUB85742.1 hypothetical protein BK788_12370 [Bacillus thuringiensis serovar sinensis]